MIIVLPNKVKLLLTVWQEQVVHLMLSRLISTPFFTLRGHVHSDHTHSAHLSDSGSGNSQSALNVSNFSNLSILTSIPSSQEELHHTESRQSIQPAARQPEGGGARWVSPVPGRNRQRQNNTVKAVLLSVCVAGPPHPTGVSWGALNDAMWRSQCVMKN